MSDEQTPELDAAWLLASASLDGESGAGAVDGELVALLRRLQDGVRDVVAPSAAARESAIAAALAEFDLRSPVAPAAHAPAPAPSPTRGGDNVVSLWSRPSTQRWLGAAAAVLAIGAIGVVLSRSGGSDDSAEAPAGAEETAATESAQASAEALDQLAVDAATAAPAGSNRTVAAEPAPAAEMAAEEALTEQTAAEMVTAEAESGIGDAAILSSPAGASTVPVTYSAAAPIPDSAALLVVVDELEAARADGTLAIDPAALSVCANRLESGVDLIAPALYGNPPRQVLVGRDASANAVAIDVQSCVVVAVGDRP